MNNSTVEILVEMQKTEPTGTEERSCRKVSFAAPVLHKHCYLTFHASQLAPLRAIRSWISLQLTDRGHSSPQFPYHLFFLDTTDQQMSSIHSVKCR